MRFADTHVPTTGMGAEGLLEDPLVVSIAEAHNCSAAQVTLRHSLQLGCAVLAKSLSSHRIRENLNVFGSELQLSDEEMMALTTLGKNERSYWDNSQVP